MLLYTSAQDGVYVAEIGSFKHSRKLNKKAYLNMTETRLRIGANFSSTTSVATNAAAQIDMQNSDRYEVI